MIQEVTAEALWRLSRVSGPVIGANGDRIASDYNSPPKLCRSLVNAIHIMDRKTSLALLFVSAIWKFPCFHRSASIPLKADAALDAATPSSGAVRHPSSPRHFFSLRSSLGFARASLTALCNDGLRRHDGANPVAHRCSGAHPFERCRMLATMSAPAGQ